MPTSTRDRILDAALAAFATRGVDGTAITDLEEAAGLAPGSGGFYRYFKTKDEALEAVVRREIDRVQAIQDGDEATPPPDEDTDPRELILEGLRQGMATLRSVRPLMAILAREHGRIPALAAEISDRLVEGGLRHDAARIAVQLGGVDPDEARRMTAVVMSSMVGYVLATDYFGAAPGGIDRDQFTATLADLLAPR